MDRRGIPYGKQAREGDLAGASERFASVPRPYKNSNLFHAHSLQQLHLKAVRYRDQKDGLRAFLTADSWLLTPIAVATELRGCLKSVWRLKPRLREQSPPARTTETRGVVNLRRQVLSL